MGEDDLRQLNEVLDKTRDLAEKENKRSGFFVGNNFPRNSRPFYFTPIRNTSLMTVGGMILHQNIFLRSLLSIIDGKVDFIFFDVEKKIPPAMLDIEKDQSSLIRKSRLIPYKGNDISIWALETFISHFCLPFFNHSSPLKVAILGAGNLGSKLALKLVESGHHVSLSRRDKEKLDIIVTALNLIKNSFSDTKIHAAQSNHEAAQDSNLIIGMTHGTPVINSSIVSSLASKAIIIDGGKGNLTEDAIEAALAKNYPVFRMDIEYALEGLIANTLRVEEQLKSKIGRTTMQEFDLVSGGLLAQKGEIVVDNYQSPRIIYGIGDGKGNILQDPPEEMKLKLLKLECHFSNVLFKSSQGHPE